MLIWTINDFSASRSLSRCRTHGYYAYPPCSQNLHSKWLVNSKKNVFLDHRRFLPKKISQKKDWFDGSDEKCDPSIILDSKQILREIEGIQNKFGKPLKGKRKRQHEYHELFRKKLIFFNLPYWMV